MIKIILLFVLLCVAAALWEQFFGLIIVLLALFGAECILKGNR